MANMSYCRFQNTLSDMHDCHTHFDDSLSETESKARKRMFELCKTIVEQYDGTDLDWAEKYDPEEE